jgi:hypothetical protein
MNKASEAFYEIVNMIYGPVLKKKGERSNCALPLEEEVNEEGPTLPSRAAAGAHSHAAARTVPAAALSITGAKIPGVRQAALQLGLLLGGQKFPGFQPMLRGQFLELGLQSIDLFLLDQNVLLLRVFLSPERAEFGIPGKERFPQRRRIIKMLGPKVLHPFDLLGGQIQIGSARSKAHSPAGPGTHARPSTPPLSQGQPGGGQKSDPQNCNYHLFHFLSPFDF